MKRFMGIALALFLLFAVLVPASQADAVALDQEVTALVAGISVDAVVPPQQTSIDYLIPAIQALEGRGESETTIAAISVNVLDPAARAPRPIGSSNVLKMPHARGT